MFCLEQEKRRETEGGEEGEKQDCKRKPERGIERLRVTKTLDNVSGALRDKATTGEPLKLG